MNATAHLMADNKTYGIKLDGRMIRWTQSKAEALAWVAELNKKAAKMSTMTSEEIAKCI